MDVCEGAGIILSLLEDLGLVYQMFLRPELVGFDPGFYGPWNYIDLRDAVKTLLEHICEVGWDRRANEHAICVERPSSPQTKPNDVFGALTCPIVNQVLRAIASGIYHSSDRRLAVDGYLNLEHIRGFDPCLAAAAHQGFWWRVIHSRANILYPEAFAIIQSAWTPDVGNGYAISLRAHEETKRLRIARDSGFRRGDDGSWRDGQFMRFRPIAASSVIARRRRAAEFGFGPRPSARPVDQSGTVADAEVSLAASSASAPGGGAITTVHASDTDDGQ